MTEPAFPEIAPLSAVLGMAEVSDLLGIHATTIRRLVADGSLPGHRVPGGRQWIFRTEEILRAVSSWEWTEDAPVDASAEPSDEPVDEVVEDWPSSDENADDTEVVITPDPLDVWCPAPPRSADLDEASWRSACTDSWIEAARREHLTCERAGADDLVDVDGVAYEVQVGLREKVLVLDDYGDEQWELIETVWTAK